MCENELGFYNWILKINEKLMFAVLSIKEHRDISEDDYGLLKALHDRVWYVGAYPLYQTTMDIPDERAVQNTLFSENMSEKPAGTDIETPPVNN